MPGRKASLLAIGLLAFGALVTDGALSATALAQQPKSGGVHSERSSHSTQRPSASSQ